MTDSCNSSSSSLKFSDFFFWLKTKNQLKKSLILLKTFPYLLAIPSTKSHLVTYLALYKEEQATTLPRHTNTTTHLSHTLLFWNIIILLSISLNISFSISLTKSLLFRKQHNPWKNTKNHSSSNYKLMYLLYLTFILSISCYHIFYKHIPHKLSIHISHIYF